jgi:hypothetical protein
MDEYRLWIDELGRCERVVDNYRTGDLVIGGAALAEATRTVADERARACAANQQLITAAATFDDRIEVLNDILVPLWAAIDQRPWATIQRFVYALRPTDPATQRAEIDRSLDETKQRNRQLTAAGLTDKDHYHLFNPTCTFAEGEHQKATILVAKLQQRIEDLEDELAANKQ